MKKVIWSVLCVLFASESLFADSEAAPFDVCAFCDPVVLEYQTFYEDEVVLALYTHKPIFPGHCLVIPKRHVERFEQLSDEEVAQMGQVIKKVNGAVTDVFKTSSYLLLQKNGHEVGQTVPHVHFHYIPRQEGDDSLLKYLWKMFVVNLGVPISSDEMQFQVMRLRQAIAESEGAY